jgi:hypothetical protein
MPNTSASTAAMRLMNIGSYLGVHDTNVVRCDFSVGSRVHDAPLAEDLTGEVFTRMIVNLPNYRDRSLPFRAWLYQMPVTWSLTTIARKV